MTRRSRDTLTLLLSCVGLVLLALIALPIIGICAVLEYPSDPDW